MDSPERAGAVTYELPAATTALTPGASIADPITTGCLYGGGLDDAGLHHAAHHLPLFLKIQGHP
ncbi:MAG: hypothetical protein ACLSB9_34115 [Hydrogeniiclostridium mannosilyticum]